MSFASISELPDTARLWIFAAAETLNSIQSDLLTTRMNQFLQEWTAHKRELRPAWELRYDRFILIALDETLMPASGCSIDNMVHHLRDYELATGLNIVNSSSEIFYRDKEGAIQSVARTEFKALVQKGLVDDETIVFNNIIQTLGELREGGWEIAMKLSWHKQTFDVMV